MRISAAAIHRFTRRLKPALYIHNESRKALQGAVKVSRGLTIREIVSPE